MDHEWMAAVTKANLANVLLLQGQWVRARASASEAARVLALLSHAAAPYPRLVLAWVDLRTGESVEIDDADVEACEQLSPGEAWLFRVERALADGSAAAARARLNQPPQGDASTERYALDAAVLLLDGVDVRAERLSAAEAAGDRLAAVFLRSMLGADLAADPDAKELGVVDVPIWARPIS
jgi:hypothetical protein